MYTEERLSEIHINELDSPFCVYPVCCSGSLLLAFFVPARPI